MTPDTAAAILNISTSSPRTEIDKAFRLRSRMSHPDRFAGAPAADIRAATAEFVRVTEARNVLHSHLLAPEPRPPQPQPMSFEDFVRVRDAQAWSVNPRTTPQARADSTPPESGISGGWVALILIIIVLIVVGVGVSQSTTTEQDNAGNATSNVDIYDSVLQEDLDEAATARLCSAENGCWSWTLTSETDCQAAEVTVEFSETLDGDPVSSHSQVVTLVADLPVEFVDPGNGESAEWAAITAIVC
ncbi:hypothetical protein E3T39_07345 [Cryobacterium suzukii]|uniref:J domain-containing protein n=1 Tax=Cryobacterium suzukii TaxID=1259198 RepID=A0A4R9AFK0_9MICO|nr:J domain-containing protein [Cryobacterium suzukii]TFD60918.1 hypothetical protein E3T39_07345 [Cryobacterium suzukii]